MLFRSIPKRTYVRSLKMMEAYRLLPCQFDGGREVICGVEDGTVCGAHSNWSVHGKGKNIKADDNRAASMCSRHHDLIDQNKQLSEADRKKFWWRAHVRTVKLLLRRSLWPKSVPVPDIDHNPF